MREWCTDRTNWQDECNQVGHVFHIEDAPPARQIRYDPINVDLSLGQTGSRASGLPEKAISRSAAGSPAGGYVLGSNNIL